MSLAVMVIWANDSLGTVTIPIVTAQPAIQCLAKRPVFILFKMDVSIATLNQHQVCHGSAALFAGLVR